MRMVGVSMAKSKINNEIQGTSQGAFEPIAIIGLSCILPDSPDIETFWQNVLNAKVSISEIKTERWGNIADFYDSEGSPGSVKENMTYSKIGGFVEGFEFDWRRWRQPPGTLKQIDISQQWAVEASASALEHAGYGDGGKELPNASTGVIFANALGGENRGYTTMLIHEKEAIRIAKESGMTDEAEFIRKWRDNRPVVNEDTMPGELANVVAGRVANLLDLQGPNYTTDAACATSMAALLDSCRQLQSRQVDVALCGASDRTMDPASYVKFSAIGALSATHSTPFDSGANGFVMGEGSGVMVLKRLSDAITDGDTIYSVVRGIGASSDGRGKGITAPSQRGQMQAVARAYSQSGYSATTVELVEAHGTSTKVGDATELGTLSKFFAEVPSGENIAVGSIKSQIGHLKAAAGMAGMLKTTLALHHRTIPPSAGFSNPNDTVDWNQNPFFIPIVASEWPSPSSGTPRRAGVSAFGFGGTNFHVAMEAYDPEFHAELAQIWNESKNAADAILSSAGATSVSRKDNQSLANVPSILDSSASPSMTHEELKAIEGGILLLSAATIEELQAKLSVAGKEILSAGPNFDDDPRGQRLSIVLEEASKSFEISSVRLALIATSWADFEKRLALAEKALADPAKWSFLAAQGIFVTNNPAFPNEAKVAHMYPGQGSQYVGMTYDLSMRYSPVVDVWTQADETMVDVLDGETLSSFVLRHELSTDEMKEAENKLKQTEYTQPAMLTSDLAIEKLLNAHGHSPDMVAGHSLGEYAALMSSGILAMDGALRAAAARGTEMGSVDIADTGLMASIVGPFDEISRIITEVDGYVIAANKNSPKMTVIAGETEPVKQAIAKFDEAGMQSAILQTSHAFHSRIVEPANKPLRKFLEGLEINWPTIPISSNVDGGWYPMAAGGSDSKSAILEKLAPQMASAVEWTKQVESMYDAGARIFIEVGPKRALTMFASQILDKKTHLAIMSNHPKQGGIASFLQTLAMLSLAGRKTEWPAGKSSILTEAFRAGPIEAHQMAKELGSAGQVNNLSASTSSADWEDLRTRSRPLPSTASLSTVDAEHSPTPTTPAPLISPPSQATSIGDNRAPGPRKLFIAEDLEHVAIEEWIGEILSNLSGYPTSFCKGSIGLMAGLRLSEEQISQVIIDIGSMTLTDSGYDVKNIQTAGDLARWVTKPPQGWVSKSPESFVNPTIHTIASTSSTQSASQVSSRSADPYVVTGISLGLPGGERVFDEGNFEKLIRGETCITEVSDQKKQQILDKNIVRLIKGRDGQARMEPAENFSDLPQLAGQAAEFDLVEEFGIPAKVARAWDVTTRLAVASGLLALRDAGIPLTPEEKIGKGGLRLITNWRVPSVYRDRTGIIFACCFPGNASMAGLARREGDDGEGKFDRSYLFQVLPMGHSQFAQTTGIRGPNTTINNACASTAAAFSIAEDWLDVGKVDRVVIISGDDVTGDELWEWIGAGFAASGAASTGNSVEDVALPFDARRNGLVLGMGAASFVIEKKSGAAERGVQPYAELLGTRMANSAFHGTRLDVDHVSNTMNDFIGEMESKWKLSRKDIAPHTFFMSHETYTPARGGSAQAEVKSLRSAFGDSTDSLVITNTKGFTGHPMGVGIEDVVLIHALATGRAPPIANHKEVDSELGNLNLSKGGQFEGMKYGLRFAAGFGSQLVVTLWKASDVIGQRIDGGKLLQWNKNLAGTDELVLRVLQNKLVAFINSNENLHGGLQGDVYEVTENIPHSKQQKDTVEAVEAIPTAPIPPAAPPMPEVKEIPSDTAEASPASISEAIDIPAIVIDVVVKHTGYPADFIELDQDLEGELGIDTVKQSEIMGDIRERFSIELDENFSLAEHSTLNHFVTYIAGKIGSSGSSTAVTTPAPTPAPTPASATPLAPTLPPTTTAAPDPVPTPTVASAQPSKEGGDIASAVIEVVVKHTGYPADFIELDQDLEGELGIDTVKQAEIMGDIRQIFSIELDEDFSLADHPTLNHFVTYIAGQKGVDVAPVAASSPEPTPAEPVTSTAPEPSPQAAPQDSISSQKSQDDSDKGGIIDGVLDLVVTHTGYPKDFLELDQDLEGELGIDTVKQAEIMGDLREKYSLPLDEDFSLSDYPTLEHFVNYIVSMLQGVTDGAEIIETAEPASPVEPESPVEAMKPVALEDNEIAIDVVDEAIIDSTLITPGVGLHRWQVEIEEAEGISESLDLTNKLVVVTEDGWDIAGRVCSLLEKKNIATLRLSFEPAHKKFTEEVEGGQRILRVDPTSPQQLEEASEAILASGDCAGIIHLAPTQLASQEWTIADSDTSGAVAMQGLFGILKHIDSTLANGAGCVASLTALDGRHGNKGKRFNSLAAGASGIVKSYAHERTNLRCRAWDIHPEALMEPEELAERLVNDLFDKSGEVEIGLDLDGRRWALVLFDEKITTERTPLQSDDIWLVSGGGSGVTASAIIGVAQSSVDAGAHFVLLGRTKLIEEASEWLDWSNEQLNERKMQLREELIEEAGGEKVSIVAWNNAWAPYVRSKDICTTISAISATGNSAQYFACDTTDSETLGEIGKEIGEDRGAITGIIHGAGIEDSKLVGDKNWDVFSSVIRVKVDGWKALVSAAESSGIEDLRVACSFTSVAGRFGNGGQTDYAAANSVLDVEMARLSASGKTQAVAIAWTGWKDVGMATRGSLESIFEAAGIDTLPVDVGVNIFVDEVLAGGKRRVVACGALGLMDQYDSFRAPPLKLPAEMAAIIADPTRFPFIDRILSFEEGVALAGESLLSTEEMPFLVDHSIEGVPYHPGVMALEMFAEHALLLCPEYALAGFEDVTFGLPIKLVKGPLTIRTVATISKSEGEVIWVKAWLESDLVNSKGQIFGKPRQHHDAIVRLIRKSDDLTGHFANELSASPQIGIPMPGEVDLQPGFIYERYFHGPRFQSHGGVIRGVGEGNNLGCDGVALMRHQMPETDQWASETAGGSVLLEALPMLIEAGFQNAGLVAMEAEGFSSLPVGIQWSTILRVPDKGESLRLRSVITEVLDGGVTTHDVIVVGDDDSPVLAMKGLKLKAMAIVQDNQRFSLQRANI